MSHIVNPGGRTSLAPRHHHAAATREARAGAEATDEVGAVCQETRHQAQDT